MTKRQVLVRDRSARLGAALLASGSSVLVLDTVLMALRFHFDIHGDEFPGFGAALAFGFLRAFGAAAFDPRALLPLASNLLVPFSALVIIVAGLTLLGSRHTDRNAESASRALAQGGQHGLI